MNELLQSEIDWINKNSHWYDSEIHKDSVIENIKKRYFISKAKELINSFNMTRITRDRFELFEHFGIN